MLVRTADYIMNALSEHGVKHLFMVSGRGVLYLTDAAAKAEEIKAVPMHHEQSCAFAAMAYAQYNNTLGACLVSTGCASTNALTGVLCAWQDGVPMVVISGQNTLKETVRYSGVPLRTWGQQEADIVSLAEHITKYAVMLTSADKAVYEVEKALYLASHGRKGPVLIDVPLDIQNMRIEPDELEHFCPETEKSELSEDDLDYVVKGLNSAKRPVVLIGSGIRHSNSVAELKEFVEENKIPCVYASSTPDVYGYDKTLCMGSVGVMACSRSGCFAVQNSDLLLVVGHRLSPMTTGSSYEKFAREAKVVVVDIDEIEHSKNTVRIDRFIKADAKEFLLKLNTADIKVDYSEWVNKCAHWKKIFPLCEDFHRNKEKIDLYELAEALSEHLPEDAVLVSDAGLEELILPSNVIFGNDRRCIHPFSQGAMGFALPAAIGAYYSSGRPVIAVIGDGSIMMNLQELATIKHNDLPIKIIVVSNNMYSVIRKRQKDLFRTRTIGTDCENGVGTVEFEKISDCFGMNYFSINSPSRLTEGIKSFLSYEGAALCELYAIEDQDYNVCSIARTSDRRYVLRPLEDQAPFMNRDLFLSEMIVEPIDQ